MNARGDLTIGVLYPSEFLKAEDLKDRPVTVTIAGVSHEGVPMSGGKTERKVVLRFEKTNKKMIAGKTNGYALALLLCPSMNLRECVGKRVTLCPDIDRFGGQRVPAIRIAGSPDAHPDRADAYARAWKGKREGGALVGRIKRALGLFAVTAAPPIEPEDAPPPEREPESDATDAAPDELFGDDTQ